MATKKLDFSKETFQEGQTYLESDILEMANRNNTKVNVHTPLCMINRQMKIAKTALHINFKEDDIDLWFIMTGYNSAQRIYKCVWFR